MPPSDYHQKIIDYYRDTENAYKDSWDLNNSLAIHYGYWDEKVNSFPASLTRMNEVMMEKAKIQSHEKVLDAGCGVGGSSIFLAKTLACYVTGITLSERQVQQAKINAQENEVEPFVDFQVMDFCRTSFDHESFDIVWGCESICYADNKEEFIREAFRLLRPGGRLILADGFVTDFENNQNPVIKKWLEGWQVNYLESPARMQTFLQDTGFTDIAYQNISQLASRSSKRLYRFYFLARLYLLWKKINFSKPATDMQKKNIMACKYQYYGMKKKLWQYGLLCATKPK